MLQILSVFASLLNGWIYPIGGALSVEGLRSKGLSRLVLQKVYNDPILMWHSWKCPTDWPDDGISHIRCSKLIHQAFILITRNIPEDNAVGSVSRKLQFYLDF